MTSGERRVNPIEEPTMNRSALSFWAAAKLVVLLSWIFIVPSVADAATVITINDLVEGTLPPPTIVDQPPGVPGIQNVITGNEMLSFTYDDLVPAGATRTRLLFLIEPGTNLPSDEFRWSV